MKSIIKWPGGKSTEYKNIKQLIPDYDRYVEPFFGGGAIFFKEEPKSSIINDLNEDLISFYSLIKTNNSIFYYYLEELLTIRNKIFRFTENNSPKLSLLFKELIHQNINKKEFKIKTKEVLNNNREIFNELFSEYEMIESNRLFKEIINRLNRKIIRVNKIIQKDKKQFTEQDLLENIKTGFVGGLYYHLRDRYNNYRISEKINKNEMYFAIYYYVREFCYGSMFRFNKSGGFNVPYGGNSYNEKDFEEKIKGLYKAQKYFKNTKVYNLDFKDFFNKVEVNKNDFIFLDPPYHSEFSTYGENEFTKKDQKRLEKSLRNISGNFLLIIKNTDFIYNLYNRKEYNINSFNKKYSANIKNRNNREVKHLIITNY